MNCCKVEAKAAIIEPIINHHDVYCEITVHPQNIEVSVFLNTSFFCFEKLLMT